MGLVLNVALIIGDKTGDIKGAIGLLVFIAIVIFGGLSLLGICLCKEGKYPVSEEKSELIKLKDIWHMLKTNKPLLVYMLANLSAGFCWMIVAAVEFYYVKWAYCADLSTGAVDNVTLAMFSTILGMATVVPIFTATPFSPLFIRKTGSNANAMIVAYGIGIIPSVLIFILQLTGVLQMSFWILFVLALLMAVTITGLTFVPGYNIMAECMDYNRYISGKGMGGLVNAITQVVQKGQNAISGAVVGLMLIAVGYNVDSATGDYIGDLSKIPSLLNNFTVLMGLVPAILAAITVVIYKKLYPITPEIKQKMKEKLEMEEN
jgi:GPH family glycoside/pentoside/hexuronide:cation symporter